MGDRPKRPSQGNPCATSVSRGATTRRGADQAKSCGRCRADAQAHLKRVLDQLAADRQRDPFALLFHIATN